MLQSHTMANQGIDVIALRAYWETKVAEAARRVTQAEEQLETEETEVREAQIALYGAQSRVERATQKVEQATSILRLAEQEHERAAEVLTVLRHPEDYVGD
jgi:chromosome segregation ATPase